MLGGLSPRVRVDSTVEQVVGREPEERLGDACDQGGLAVLRGLGQLAERGVVPTKEWQSHGEARTAEVECGPDQGLGQVGMVLDSVHALL